MATDKLGNTSIKSIRAFLELWPMFSSEMESFFSDLSEKDHQLFNEKTEPFTWCYFYELPFEQHLKVADPNLFKNSQLEAVLENQFLVTDSISAVPGSYLKAKSIFESSPIPTKEQTDDVSKSIPKLLGYSLSCYLSLKSILYYGKPINELIASFRAGDDDSLFNAIRVDPTVIGCPSAIARISKAKLLNEDGFSRKLRLAINNKPRGRDQKNYQKMRLVLRILYEEKAPRLDNDQLYNLFVESLNLYHWDAKEGGNEKALRKIVDTYMKKPSTT